MNRKCPDSVAQNLSISQGVPRDVAEIVIQKVKVLEAAWKGGELEGLDEKCMPLWAIICHEVKKQKERLGGDFAVAQAVMSRCVKIAENSV